MVVHSMGALCMIRRCMSIWCITAHCMMPLLMIARCMIARSTNVRCIVHAIPRYMTAKCTVVQSGITQSRCKMHEHVMHGCGGHACATRLVRLLWMYADPLARTTPFRPNTFGVHLLLDSTTHLLQPEHARQPQMAPASSQSSFD